MANFNDIATNQDMVNIANAIRTVTRTTDGMTISEMPERLWNIRVVQTIVKTITVEQAATSLMLGVFDGKIKHLFIVTPLNTQDAVILAKAKANLPLSIVQTGGDDNSLVNISLETEKAIPQETQLQFRIIDLLLPNDEATAGFVVNASTGSGGKAELYDTEASYEVGDTFLLNGNLGITTVDHGAEPFNPQHNEVLASQIWDTQSNSFIDLLDLATTVAGKLDTSAVVNERTDSASKTYSTRYVNSAFAPLSFAQTYYANKADSTNANLNKTPPTPAAENILTNTKANTDYDWSNPDFRFNLTLDSGIVISNKNGIEMELAFKVNTHSTVSWGAKLFISTDDGATYSAVSDTQAYGAETYEADVGNKLRIFIPFDLLTELKTLPAETKIRIELYKKQNVEITTTIHCGVSIDGATINTTTQMLVANVVIDTAQIEDGAVTTSKIADEAVTYTKLAQNIKDVVDNALLKPIDPADNVFTYVDSQGTQHYVGIDTATLEIINDKLSAGIELVEV